MNNRLLNIREVSEILNLRPSTLYEKVRKGLIPFIELWSGKRKTSIRFRKEDLEKFISNRAKASKK